MPTDTERKSPLFGSWLEQTRQLQTEAYGRDPWEMMTHGEEFPRFMTWNAHALMAELVEAMDELNWKPWSTKYQIAPTPAERKRFIGEMVDLLHFAGNMLAAVRCTDLELRLMYIEKMQRNRARMATGEYDGRSDKCPSCGRALDDVGTHTVHIGGIIGDTLVCNACGVRVSP